MTHGEEVRLIPPWGGTLVDLLVPEDRRAEVLAEALRLPSAQISERAVCDLELLATGAFSPLDRFMGTSDLESVLETMRLSRGPLFPIPVTLPVPDEIELHLDRRIALRNSKNEILAVLQVEEIASWDRAAMAQKVLQTRDQRHPLVAELPRWGNRIVSGPLQVLQLPRRYDFRDLRLTPSETRSRLAQLGRSSIVAFQTRNPLHRAHEAMTKEAMARFDAVLLLHPVVGLTKPGDVDHYTRVRTYRALCQNYYEPERVLLALLPLAMRMAGPREALWHALIRRNYGANFLIVGRDHASPGLDSKGRPFYDPFEACAMVERYAAETGVNAVPFHELVYVPSEQAYRQKSSTRKDQETLSISGTQVRESYLNPGVPLPEWFTRPEVAAILSESYPPRHRQGVCIWFTGLSGAGKSTTAEVLTELLLANGRQVTVLDGDVVRTHLSKGLGFSRADRDTNIRRIGFVAAEIVRHGGAVICAAVSPYRTARNEVRRMMPDTQFVEIFVDTPLEECERRDTKGMYARARRGEIRGFTGIDDPYERPENPEVTIETVLESPASNAERILRYLAGRGFLRGSDQDRQGRRSAD